MREESMDSCVIESTDGVRVVVYSRAEVQGTPQKVTKACISNCRSHFGSVEDSIDESTSFATVAEVNFMIAECPLR